VSLYFHRSSSLPLANAAICAGLAAAIAMNEYTLTIITAVFAGLTVIFYIAKEFVYPAVRHYRLKTRPIDLYFIVTSADRYDLGYVEQDENQHRTLDLVVPTHCDDLYIAIIYQSNLAFNQTHFVFSFNAGSRDQHPLIKHWFLEFIRVGINKKLPGETPTHFIDHHDAYHITDVAFRPKGQWATYGFKVSTRGPGVYRAQIEISADGVEYATSLSLYVEEIPKTIVRCVDHPDCFIRPRKSEELDGSI
jgi:hypothetical protein